MLAKYTALIYRRKTEEGRKRFISLDEIQNINTFVGKEVKDRRNILGLDREANQISGLLDLVKALRELSAKERELFRARFLSGFSLDAIAKMYKVKPTTIRVRLYRLRKKLQQSLR